MKRYRKKAILLTLLFLLAGAVVNVAVAWAIVWAWSLPGGQHLFGKVVDEDEWALPLVWPLPVPVEDVNVDGTNREPRPSQPDSVSRRRVHLAGLVAFQRTGADCATSPDHWMSVETSGWPLRSLERREGDRDWEELVRLLKANRCGWENGGLDAGLWYVNAPAGRLIFFPLRPRPAEFAINSVFFGSLLAGLYLGPFALRRWARRKRGACAACGYSLRGNPAAGVCSECGHASVGRSSSAGERA